MVIGRRHGTAVAVGLLLFLLSSGVAVAAPLGRSVAASLIRCQVSSSFTVHPSSSSNPEEATDSETSVVVPVTATGFGGIAVGTNQLVDVATGKMPGPNPFPGQTWQMVSEAFPGDSYPPYTKLPADNYILIVGVAGPEGSGQVSTGLPTWRWIVTYSIAATSCPKGATALSTPGTGTTTTTPAATTPATPTVTARQEPDGSWQISFTKSPATADKKSTHYVIDAPGGHTITKVKGSGGLTCTNNHSSAECTASPATGVKIDSVIVELSPISDLLKEKLVRSQGTITDEITIPPPALPVKHATLEEQITKLKAAIALEHNAISDRPYNRSEEERAADDAANDLYELADDFEEGSAVYADLIAAAKSAREAGYGNPDIYNLPNSLHAAEAALAALTALAEATQASLTVSATPGKRGGLAFIFTQGVPLGTGEKVTYKVTPPSGEAVTSLKSAGLSCSEEHGDGSCTGPAAKTATLDVGTSQKSFNDFLASITDSDSAVTICYRLDGDLPLKTTCPSETTTPPTSTGSSKTGRH